MLMAILYINMALVFARLCSRDSQPKSEIIAFTEPGSVIEVVINKSSSSALDGIKLHSLVFGI
jgi:hypothetical protein